MPTEIVSQWQAYTSCLLPVSQTSLRLIQQKGLCDPCFVSLLMDFDL